MSPCCIVDVLKGREYWDYLESDTLRRTKKPDVVHVQAKAASVIGGGESWLAVSRQIDECTVMNDGV